MESAMYWGEARLSAEIGNGKRRERVGPRAGGAARLKTQERVLIVEDEAIIALELEASVESLGYRVSGIASTATEAVRLAADRHPDVILMDVRLGRGGSGVEAAAEILARRSVPIIFCTAYAGDPQTLAQMRCLGPSAILSKPIDRRTLGAALGAARGGSSGTA